MEAYLAQHRPYIQLVDTDVITAYSTELDRLRSAALGLLQVLLHERAPDLMSGPFGRPGSWLRCQFHAHTTNSDGEATPEGLADHYARAGFDVLAITDHWHVTEHPSDRILVIGSSELSARVDETLERRTSWRWACRSCPR